MKKDAWQVHVDAYKNSKQSITAYATENGLVYSQMLYWVRKLSDDPTPKMKPKAEPKFVAIELKKNKTKPVDPVLGILEFPSGIKLHIHNAELLNGIPDLWLGKS